MRRVNIPKTGSRFIAGIVLASIFIAGPVGAAPMRNLARASVIATSSKLMPLDLSCSSRSFCMALMRQGTDTGASVYSARWNGSKVSAPHRIPGATYLAMDDTGGISALSCVSSKFCIAVGQGQMSKTSFRWSGKDWRAVAIPSPSAIVPAPAPASIQAELVGWTSISCATRKFCVAVGTSVDAVTAGASTASRVATTFMLWNGTSWIHQSTLQGVDLTAVSCSSTTSCVAIGASSAAWNGTLWRQVSVPGETSNPVTSAYYSGISCVAHFTCVAVGSSPVSTTAIAPAVIEWTNGAWHTIAPPAPPSSSGPFLNQIDCQSVTLCVASGYTALGRSEPALLSVWNGRFWTSAMVPGQIAVRDGAVDFTSNSSDIAIVTSNNGSSTLWLKG